jgi:hypothetical protein
MARTIKQLQVTLEKVETRIAKTKRDLESLEEQKEQLAGELLTRVLIEKKMTLTELVEQVESLPTADDNNSKRIETTEKKSMLETTEMIDQISHETPGF